MTLELKLSMLCRMFAALIAYHFLTAPVAYADEATLVAARQMIVEEKYDSALQILGKFVEQNPKSADGHLLMANAFHWKKDIAKAKTYYLKAGQLDENYKLAIVPLLDEAKEWKEIVKLLSPRIEKLEAAPQLLGSLATAYKELGKMSEAERVIAILAERTFENVEDENYKNYVLAYYHLWHKNDARSKEFLKKISSRALLTYAGASPKFERLFSDAEFIRLTGRKAN